MSEPTRIRHAAAAVIVAATLCSGAAGAVAQEGKRSESQIYQQRMGDGRIVLTDRPVAGAVTQRTWSAAAEDPVAAHQRRQEAQLEALAVSERIQRQIEAALQRDHELALARMQFAEASARLDAERARADLLAQPAVVFVRSFAHPRLPRPPHIDQPPPRPRLLIRTGSGTLVKGPSQVFGDLPVAATR